MIPVKLLLKNFMSYGDHNEEVPFEDLHVACLCGDNGNGKSALLDAITWVLWGKTRVSSTRAAGEDDLIRLGTDDMAVRFVFDLGESRYRVTRTRRRGKAGTWALEERDAAGEWQVRGSKSRDVAEQVERLLHMNYETFLQSAYLQQGQADLFARLTPGERKKTLGSILGLERYERLAEMAREEARAAQSELTEMEREKNLLDDSVAGITELKQQMADLKDRMNSAKTALLEQENAQKQKQAEFTRLQGLADQEKQGDVQIQKLANSLQEVQEEARQIRERIQEYAQLLKEREAIERDHAYLLEARQQRDALAESVQKRSDVKQEQTELQNHVQQEENKRISVLSLKRSELTRLEQDCSELEQQRRQQQALQQQQSSLAHAAEELKQAADELTRAEQAFQTLKSEHEAQKKQQVEEEELLKLLQSVGAECPTCGASLDSAQRTRVVRARQERLQEIKGRITALIAEGKIASEQRNAARQAAAQREEEDREARKIAVQLQGVQERLQALEGVEKQHLAMAAEIAALQTELSSGAFAQPKRIRLAQVDKELVQLERDYQQHSAILAKIANLEKGEARYQRLQQAETGRTEAEKQTERLQARELQMQKEIAELRSSKEALQKGQQDLPQTRQALAEIQQLIQKLREESDAVQRDQGAAARGLQHAEASKQRLENMRGEMEKKREEYNNYTELARIFGRNGVQAQIIENALPELEQEANNLLERMTGGEMKVELITTAKSKTAKTDVETLDIRISDRNGTRPFELYSGGEAFRVSFALRIALSRLLANRAGAKLQTLILDEGFGSQDGKGREKLIEVIESIKDDFSKILVITHIDDLKDSFSSRIEISKDNAGSHVRVA